MSHRGYFDSSKLKLDDLGASKWQKDRARKPKEMLQQNEFTDFIIKVDEKEYRAHRLILAIHSDYFHGLFSSGMKEVSEGVVELKGIKVEVFDLVFSYIYTGQLKAELSDDALSEVVEVASMLQIADLEVQSVSAFLATMKPSNCIEKKIQLSQMQAFANDPTLKEGVIKTLDDFVGEAIKDTWKEIVQSPGFVELDIHELTNVLRVKSMEEELGDFSYSFTQSDLMQGICHWLTHDLENRQNFIESHLASFYCLHQVSGGQVNAMLKLQGCSPGFKDVDELCQGAFCPRRIVRGLLLVFARTPWDVSEHLLYYFVLPPWDDDERVLQRSAFYHLPNILPSVGENGEVTLITPNNFVALSDLDSHMCLVLNESGKLTGTLLDGLNETYKCGHHHSDIYRHCPTNFLSCECLENHWSFCADQVGYIWMVTSCPVTDVVAKSQQVQYDPCCPSYKMLQAPVKVFGSVSVAVNQDLYLLGGYFGEPGTDYDVVFSSQILKKRRGGSHAVVLTDTMTYGSVPVSNQRLYKYSMIHETWIETLGPPIPFEICDAALLLVKDQIYVIGGFALKQSKHNLYYLEPQRSVWILDLMTYVWRRGPDLPMGLVNDGSRNLGYARGSAYLVQEKRIIYSGGVQLSKSPAEESNQIYNYVTNARAFYLDLDTTTTALNSSDWQCIIDMSDLHQNFHDFTLYGLIPTKIRLNQLRILRGEFVKMGR